MKKQFYSTHAEWETRVGYSRAIRIGSQIEISGTAAVKDGKPFYGTAYEQARCSLEIIEGALKKMEASLTDVVRTRMYVTDITQWEEIGRAHGEYFGEIRPVTTMIEVSGLIDPGLVVEIEATAIVPD